MKGRPRLAQVLKHLLKSGVVVSWFLLTVVKSKVHRNQSGLYINFYLSLSLTVLPVEE